MLIPFVVSELPKKQKEALAYAVKVYAPGTICLNVEQWRIGAFGRWQGQAETE